MTWDVMRRAPTVLITGPDPYKLAALVQRERARRAIIVRVPLAELEPGLWAVEVSQLKPIRPGWVRPAAIAVGVAGGLGALVWMVWLILSAVAAAAAGVSLATVLGVAVVAGVVLRLTRSGGGRSVDVRVRVRG